MVLRAIKRNNKSADNKARRLTAAHRFFIGVYIFWGTLVITALSFISLAAGVLAFSCFSLGLYLLYENKRRQYWELSHSFKIGNIEKTCNDLSSASLRNTSSIQSLQRNINELALAIDDEERGDAPALKAKEESADMYTTRRQRPMSAIIANDDPFGDHKSLSDVVVQELIQSALRNKDINVFVQPIVTLPQRQIAGFEVFARIRAKPGLYVPAERYINMARSSDVLKDIDILLLQECLGILRDHAEQLTREFFCLNIEPANLKNKRYMSALLAFVSQNRALAKKLVFEIRYAEYQSLPAPLLQIMGGLAKLGCRFSLDHVDDMEFNMRDLINHNVRYLKINGSWMAAQGRSDMEFTNIWRMKNKLEANGVRVIADRIEHETDLRALLDFDPHLGQGYLFGKPDLIGSYKPFAYTQTNAKRKGTEESFG